RPVVVEDEIISLIRSRIGSDGYVSIAVNTPQAERFNEGDQVIIKDGPLREFTGIFEREMPDSDRVRLLLHTVGYQAHVEVGAGSIVKLQEQGAAATAAFA